MSNESERKKWRTLPRSKHPKPLVFHDGRIAFKPTPTSALAMFLWLPLAIPLAVLRATVFILLPYRLSIPIVAFLGMHARTISFPDPLLRANSKGNIFVCNHRTLLDPLYISAVVGRHLTATTYSVSPVSEFLSPIKTIRLTRNRQVDKATMEKLLQEGDLVVCPEGTTCREPYILRFSLLFAELKRVVHPVALECKVGMFYGTTAGGRKSLDPLYFLMNPMPSYSLEFLEKVETDVEGCDTEGKQQLVGSRDMANYVQRQIGRALGFECTGLTRKDKYLMLAGNEGVVEATDGKKLSVTVNGKK